MAEEGRAERVRRELEGMEAERRDRAEARMPHLSAREKLENFMWGTPVRDKQGVMTGRKRDGAIHTLAEGIGEAFADIRKKCVEEGWFGREVTPREVTYPGGGIHGHHDQKSSVIEVNFYELCKTNEQQKPSPSPDQGKEVAGMDR
jgi:hypothetical protein